MTVWALRPIVTFVVLVTLLANLCPACVGLEIRPQPSHRCCPGQSSHQPPASEQSSCPYKPLAFEPFADTAALGKIALTESATGEPQLARVLQPATTAPGEAHFRTAPPGLPDCLYLLHSVFRI